jgi:hypothetical protein
MSTILIQSIGFIGLFFNVISFQQKKRDGILLLMLVGQAAFLIHFILLGAWTAVGMNFVGVARTLVFRLRDQKNWAEWKYWPIIFMFLFLIAGLLAQESWLGALPVVAMFIDTMGLWMKDARKLRLISLFPHPLWFVYNLIKGSWAGVICEIFVFLSIIIAVIRYDLKGADAKV